MVKKKKYSDDIRLYGMPFRIKEDVIKLVNQIDPHKSRPFNRKLERICEAVIREGIQV